MFHHRRSWSRRRWRKANSEALKRLEHVACTATIPEDRRRAILGHKRLFPVWLYKQSLGIETAA